MIRVIAAVYLATSSHLPPVKFKAIKHPTSRHTNLMIVTANGHWENVAWTLLHAGLVTNGFPEYPVLNGSKSDGQSARVLQKVAHGLMTTSTNIKN